jgi:murein lipoprotein
MLTTKQPLAMVRTLGLAIVAAVGLASCATYDDEFATINSRLDQLDTKVQGAPRAPKSANQVRAAGQPTTGFIGRPRPAPTAAPQAARVNSRRGDPAACLWPRSFLTIIQDRPIARHPAFWPLLVRC